MNKPGGILLTVFSKDSNICIGHVPYDTEKLTSPHLFRWHEASYHELKSNQRKDAVLSDCEAMARYIDNQHASFRLREMSLSASQQLIRQYAELFCAIYTISNQIGVMS